MSALFAGEPPQPTPPRKPAPADLAPGDDRSAAFDWSGIDVQFVRGTDDPLFTRAYSFLWGHFGNKGEMEQQSVLAQRFAWRPSKAIDGWSMCYEMIVLKSGGMIAAVRDHTAIVPAIGTDAPEAAVVHLSHVLLDPAWRRTGLAGWLRAWPILTARDCLRAAGRPMNAPISLVAEMEPPDAAYNDRFVRLRAYERAGFKKVDPTHIDYHQPDFRPLSDIDASGGPRPLPMMLIVRRVGREAEPTMPGHELRHVVRSLYGMYGSTFRPADMAPLLEQLDRHYPPDDAAVPLTRPTE
jgi:GNAT superfamily N-acetyltransferase